MTGADVISAVQQYENSEIGVTVYNGSTNYFTGKYKLAFADMREGKETNAASIGRVKSYPGGVYYVGNLSEVNATEKTNLTELQANNKGGVSAVKTYYSSIVKDATTDTVVGIIFVQK